MAKRRRRSSKAAKVAAPPVETRAAEAMTVFWMLTLLATIVAEILGLILAAVALATGDKAPWSDFAKLLLMIASVTSTVCLLVTPIVLKLRKVPPPPAITWFAITISALPLVAALLALVPW